MANKKFDILNIRKPSIEEWDEETFNELLEKYPNAQVGDILYNENEDYFNSLVTSGRIFDYEPRELFWGLGENELIKLKEQLDSIDLSIHTKASKAVKEKMRKWLIAYGEFNWILKLQKGISQLPTRVTNTKIQILIFHYLQQSGYINTKEFPKDNTKVAKLLSNFLNRNYDNFYAEYSAYQRNSITNSSIFTLSNLEKVKNLFVESHFELAVELAEKDIKKIKTAKK